MLYQGGRHGQPSIFSAAFRVGCGHFCGHFRTLLHHDLVLRRRKDRTMTTLAASQSPLQANTRQQRTFDLAMTAAQMGTWRYTLADNICTYDENAQRLYGLTEARFLHSDEGVRDKFHPDDLEVMWSRVARALDPQSDGHYDVEYRVKQLDGSWRWLSAWGTVEFEGQGQEAQGSCDIWCKP
jgi:PAS domain-containing protein